MKAKRTSTRPLWLVAVSLGVLGVGGLLFVRRSDEQAVRVSAAESDKTASFTTSPLYLVPGFGRTVEAGRALDRILLYESVQRHVLIESCMASSGFQYAITDLFPANVVAQIALDAGIAPADSAEVTGVWPDELPPGQRDGYYLALWGATYAQMHPADQSLPYEGFPSRGCYVEADRTPSVRDLPRKFERQREAIRRQAAEVADAGFAACMKVSGFGAVVRQPGDVERAVAATKPGPERARYADAQAQCSDKRTQDYRRAHAVVATDLYYAHRVEFDAQIERYKDFDKRVSADAQFRDWLGTELRRLMDKYPEAAEYYKAHGKVAY